MLSDKLARIREARNHHKFPEQKRMEAKVRQDAHNALSLEEKIKKCATQGREYKRLLASKK